MKAPALASGDPGARERAFRELFDAELRYVWRTLRYLGVRPADLKDITHDVFVTVLRHLDRRPDNPPLLRAWLFSFAYHAAANYRRLARHRREVLDEVPDQEADEPSGEEQLCRHQRAELVALAMDRIDFDKRAVLVMHYIDGIPVPEIAATLEIPVNTAYSRLRLAREEFRTAIARVTRQRGES